MINRMEHGIGDTVAQIAVPGFFMISAYLFYRNFTWDKLWVKLNSRIRSILVPFILWNTIYYLGYVISSRLPFLTDIVGKGVVPFDLLTATDAILHYTYNYVFWYLYQLILLILLTPVLYMLLRRTWLGMGILLLIGAGVYLGISLPLLNLDALLYYAAAGFAGLHGRDYIETWNKKTGWVSLFVLLGVTAYRFAPGPTGDSTMAVVLYRLLTPMALWMIVDEKRLPPARAFMMQNFFLYAVHFALVRLINKTGAVLLPNVWYLPLALYILMPAAVVWISYPAGGFLRRFLPGVWRALNGGR